VSQAVGVDGECGEETVEAEGASSSAAGVASDAGGIVAAGLPAEFLVPVQRARSRWKQVCGTLAKSKAETARLNQECEALDREGQRYESAVSEHQKVVRSMEFDLRGGAQIEAERDQLSVKTRGLQEELAGLTQRMAKLEESRPSTSSFSFLSSASSSFIGGLNGREGHCVENCRRPCAVM